MFERLMKKVAASKGCTVLSLRKLEGCNTRDTHWGFGAEAKLRCGKKTVRKHIVVGADERPHNGLKLDCEPARGGAAVGGGWRRGLAAVGGSALVLAQRQLLTTPLRAASSAHADVYFLPW